MNINLANIVLPGPVAAAFLASEALVRALIGPLRSGKKYVALLYILTLPLRHPGQRRWRWIVAAPTRDYLETYVIPGAESIIGDAGVWTRGANPSVMLELNDRNGIAFAAVEVVFFALDRPAERSRYANIETTGILLVDARKHIEGVFDDALASAGSYPVDGGGIERSDVLLVSRPARGDHFLSTRPEIERHRQPGGRTPNAENLFHLAEKGFSYERAARNRPAEWVRTEIDAETGSNAAETALETIRAAAREGLAQWTSLAMPDISPVRHHQLLIEKLERLARGEIKRLMFFLPPGSAKSTYGSVLFPSWYMGNHPTHSVIAASHSKELAERFGRRVRNIVGSPVFRDTFGFGLSGDSGAAGRWETSLGGEYFAVGVDASVTGRRAHLGIIDDPVKGRVEADSTTVRNHTWEWYKADFWTRLVPGAGLLFIGTRWHDDDLAGRLLEEAKAGGEQWEVVSIQAIAVEGREDPLGRAPGERLWPEWFTEEQFEIARRDGRNWWALYQQEPMPESGEYFQAAWIRWYDRAPPRDQLHTYGASDCAVTNEGGDFTVHLVVGVDPNDDIYVLDLWRRQASSDVWVDAQLDLMQRWDTTDWAEERGQIARGVGPFLRKRQIERKIYQHRRQFPTVGDKAVRAQAIRGRMAMGKVYLPQRAPWVADFVNELLRFPAGKNDDQADAFALIGQMLAFLVRGTAPKPPVVEPVVLPEFFVANEGGRPVPRVRIRFPNHIPGSNTAPPVLVRKITERDAAEWPREYGEFCAALRAARENGGPLPGYDSDPHQQERRNELPCSGAVLKAPIITLDQAFRTARGGDLGPDAPAGPRRIL
jgi:predicted phage terminase large subunit-like protein